MSRVSLKLLFIVLIFSGVFWSAHAKQETGDDEGDEEELLDDELRATRRADISKALALLKKHSIVSKGAKIVLKSRGKHLLVDPGERIKVVVEVDNTSSPNIARDTITRLNSSKKSDELKKSTTKRQTKKSSKVKEQSQKSSKNSKERSPTRSGSKETKSTQNKHKKTAKLSTTTQAPTSKLKRTTKTSSKLMINVNRFDEMSRMQREILEAASSKTPTVVESLMGRSILEEVSQTVASIVRNRRANTLSSLSDIISESLDDQFGGHWHTVSVATDQVSLKEKKKTKKNSKNEQDDKASDNQILTKLDHSGHMMALDDHQKTATFFVTFDFGEQLRIFIFK